MHQVGSSIHLSNRVTRVRSKPTCSNDMCGLCETRVCRFLYNNTRADDVIVVLRRHSALAAPFGKRREKMNRFETRLTLTDLFRTFVLRKWNVPRDARRRCFRFQLCKIRCFACPRESLHNTRRSYLEVLRRASNFISFVARAFEMNSTTLVTALTRFVTTVLSTGHYHDNIARNITRTTAFRGVYRYSRSTAEGGSPQMCRRRPCGRERFVLLFRREFRKRPPDEYNWRRRVMENSDDVWFSRRRPNESKPTVLWPRADGQSNIDVIIVFLANILSRYRLKFLRPRA